MCEWEESSPFLPLKKLSGGSDERIHSGFIQAMAKERPPAPAALWLALRAAGAGLRVYIAQFVKGMKYSEINTLAKLRGFIAVKQYGRPANH